MNRRIDITMINGQAKIVLDDDGMTEYSQVAFNFTIKDIVWRNDETIPEHVDRMIKHVSACHADIDKMIEKLESVKAAAQTVSGIELWDTVELAHNVKVTKTAQTFTAKRGATVINFGSAAEFINWYQGLE